MRFLPTRPEELARPSGITSNDDVARALKAQAALAKIKHASRAIAIVDFDLGDHGKVADLGAGGECARDPRDEGALLGVRRAASHAETAIDARRRHPARRRHGGERRLGPLHAQRLAASRQSKRGGIEFVRAIGIARPRRPPRIGNWSGNFQRLFGFGVVAPHFAPIERPIGAIAENGARLEPLRPEAQRNHREMHGRAAHRLAAVVAAELQRVVAVDDAIVCPVELCLLGFVGGEILQRPEVGAGVERDHRESVFCELARERAAASAGADDDEIDLVIVAIFAHRQPAAGTKDVGRPAIRRARAVKWIRHGGFSGAPLRRHRPWLRLPPTDRAR